MEMEPMTLGSTSQVLLSSLQSTDTVAAVRFRLLPRPVLRTTATVRFILEPLPGLKLPECPNLTWALPLVCLFFRAD